MESPQDDAGRVRVASRGLPAGAWLRFPSVGQSEKFAAHGAPTVGSRQIQRPGVVTGAQFPAQAPPHPVPVLPGAPPGG